MQTVLHLWYNQAMKIQSLSVVVPNKGCINKCPFCVSRMVNSDKYENRMDINHPHYDINVREYLKRLRYVADNGCQTLMLTGTSEPQQNRQFLATFALLHQQIGSPFTNIEMQTTGVMLQDNPDYLRFLRNFVGVNTVALSVNSISDEVNRSILGTNYELEIPRLCGQLKDYDFNIRICCNLTKQFDVDGNDWADIFSHLKVACGCDQITFRKMYCSNPLLEQGRWLTQNEFPEEREEALVRFLDGDDPFEETDNGGLWRIGQTMYGATIYDYQGISVIYDRDCMGKNPETDVKKYLILRPNCKLYSQWDSTSSLVF